MRNKGTQDITYWVKTGTNTFGEETFGPPTVFKGRWEDRNEQVQLPSGEEVVSKAVVFVPMVVTIGSRLALGDHSSEPDPEVAFGREIQAVLSVPSLRTNQTERRVIL